MLKVGIELGIQDVRLPGRSFNGKLLPRIEYVKEYVLYQALITSSVLLGLFVYNGWIKDPI